LELGELIERQMTLSPEALVDASAAAELVKVEMAIIETRAKLERVRLAGIEVDRREAEAAKRERELERQTHVTTARSLQAQRERLAAKVDETAAEFAKALRTFDRCSTEQEVALRRAGMPQAANMARPRNYTLETVLEYHLREAGNPPRILRMTAFSGIEQPSQSRIKPLVELDAKPIESEE
jgi:hypothetical protein